MSQIDTNLQLKIASLQAAIHNAHPTMPTLLRDIHNILKADPAIVTIMSEDDIAIIVEGLKVQTKTSITQSTLKKNTKSLSKVLLDDL